MGFKTTEVPYDLETIRVYVLECIPPFTDAEFIAMQGLLDEENGSHEENMTYRTIDSDYARKLIQGCMSFRGNSSLNKEPSTAGDMSRFLLAGIEGKLTVPQADPNEDIRYYLVGGVAVEDDANSGHGVQRYKWVPNNVPVPSHGDATTDGGGFSGINSAIPQISANALEIESIKKLLTEHDIV